MQKARRHGLNPLRPLVSEQFQVLFHSSTRSAFHLSLTVLVHYRSLGSIQPYRMVPADSRRIPRAPRYSGYYYQLYTYLYGAITLYGLTFQTGSSSNTSQISWSYYPANAVTMTVWADSFSIATTKEIDISFFSSGYLDVSVPLVRSANCSVWPSTIRVAPFGNLRIKTCLQFPEAYRSLPRPSSPTEAQASSVRSCNLQSLIKRTQKK